MRSAQEAAVEAALARLDLETKVSILAGQDSWTLPAVPEIGLASIVMSDGPVGVRGTSWSADDPSIALPSPTALAATWDPRLARRAGQLLGQEARRKGVHVLLAPTVNLHRSPLGGRHFEAYSEDPLLTGAIGAAYVAGVQEQSVATTVKHLVANDFETERFTASADVSERALRELYLAPFETIVRDGGAWGVMTAYNSVNGVTMSANRAIQHDILKDEWGFDGFVVSDWLAARDTVGTANAGLDVAMPAMGSPWGARLVDAVRDGSVAPEIVDEQVRRVLRLAARVGALDGVPPAVAPADRPAPIDGAALAREIAGRSFVLATNRESTLPLDVSTLSRVALIGALAKDARVLGGGSATVFPAHVVAPLEGLTAALPDSVTLTYAVGADPRTRLAPAAAPQWTDLRAVFRDGAGTVLNVSPMPNGSGVWMDMPTGVDPAVLATVEVAGRLTAEVDGQHHLGVRGIGHFTLTAGGEKLFDEAVWPDTDDTAVLFLAPPEQRIPLRLDAGASVEISLVQQVVLPEGFAVVALSLGYAAPLAGDDELLVEAEQLAATSDVAIVVVGTTEQVESEGFDRDTLALPGRQDELVRRIAAVNARTIVVVNAGSPVELPWADDVAAVLLVWFPGQEAGHALADVLLGTVEPGGRLPTTWPVVATDCPVLSTTPVNGVLAYDEEIFIGYRAWERSGIAPRYSFGHGLGYTEWQYDRMDYDGERFTVRVQNVGDRPGRHVVQLYCEPDDVDWVADGYLNFRPDLLNERPKSWLAGFAAVQAGPGEFVTAQIAVPARTFQIWDNGGWRTVAGRYSLEIGASSTDRVMGTVITID